jgi:rSAM/selenodomain-associated transferase 2
VANRPPPGQLDGASQPDGRRPDGHARGSLGPGRCSIIVPALNEERVIGRTLRRARRLGPHELIVVDGGSDDRTRSIAQRYATVVRSLPGRGRQLNAGAALATGDLLLFLHADVRLPFDALVAIERALADPDVVGGCFRVRFSRDPHDVFLAAVYDLLRLRGRGIVYGDATIFVRRSAFEAVGGFRPYPIMEDVNLVSRLRSLGRFVELPEVVVPSNRRWRRGGRWRAWASWWAIQLLYGAGVSPIWLGRLYRVVR